MRGRQFKTFLSCSISADRPRNLARSRITAWENLPRPRGFGGLSWGRLSRGVVSLVGLSLVGSSLLWGRLSRGVVSLIGLSLSWGRTEDVKMPLLCYAVRILLVLVN